MCAPIDVGFFFPVRFIHVGGDEVAQLREWKNAYLCQALIAQGVVPSAEHLQAYFEKRIEDHLLERGRRMLAWDEALTAEQPDRPSERLSGDAAFMLWRDFLPAPDRLYDRDVVALPYTRLYFDYPTAIDRAYEFDPAPAELTTEQAAHVLGAQAAMWTGFPNGRSEEHV